MKDKSRRTEILEKSAVLFREKGYAASSIRDIAKAVGMQSPSLYNHVSSKQEILQTILLPLARRYTQGIQDIAESLLAPRLQLERAIADQVRITLEFTDAVALIPHEWVHLEPTAQASFLQLRDEYEKIFKGIIRHGIVVGDFKPVDLDIATFSILSTLRWLYSWYRKNKNINPLVLEAELVTQLIGGLEKS